MLNCECGETDGEMYSGRVGPVVGTPRETDECREFRWW